MKKKIIELSKSYLPGFVLGVITAISISVIAATYFPSKDVTYDNKESGLSSTNVQGAIDEIYGICTTPSTAGDWVLKKEPIVDSGDGLYKDEYEEGKYTYKGANPNNYVTFNNEEAGWRIISINSDRTIKIIKDASIRDIAWDTSDSYGNNNWNRPADLNTYLNGDYYNSLSSTAQSQIVEAKYYAGEVTYNNNDMKNQISDEKAVTSEVKVALPTASEYFRASSNKEQCGTFSLNNSNYSTCKNSDWMFNSDSWWTLSPDSNYSYSVFLVNQYGVLSDFAFYTYYAIRPTITLSSETQITGGDGNQNNPYQIE